MFYSRGTIVGSGMSPHVCVPDSCSRDRVGGRDVVRRARHFLSWHLQYSLSLRWEFFLYKCFLYITPRCPDLKSYNWTWEASTRRVNVGSVGASTSGLAASLPHGRGCGTESLRAKLSSGIPTAFSSILLKPHKENHFYFYLSTRTWSNCA